MIAACQYLIHLPSGENGLASLTILPAPTVFLAPLSVKAEGFVSQLRHCFPHCQTIDLLFKYSLLLIVLSVASQASARGTFFFVNMLMASQIV